MKRRWFPERIPKHEVAHPMRGAFVPGDSSAPWGVREFMPSVAPTDGRAKPDPSKNSNLLESSSIPCCNGVLPCSSMGPCTVGLVIAMILEPILTSIAGVALIKLTSHDNQIPQRQPSLLSDSRNATITPIFRCKTAVYTANLS